MSDLTEWDLGLHDLTTSSNRVDPFRDPPTLLQVAHDVAGKPLRNHDLQGPDWLEYIDARLFDRVPHRLRSRELEGHVGRVNGVVFAVVKLDLDVNHPEAGSDPVLHRGPHAFFDRRDELIRDGASEDLVLEVEALASRKRLDADVADSILAMAAGLFHVSPQRIGFRSKCRAIGDLEWELFDLNVELPLQTLDRDIKVGIAHSQKDHLMRLVVALQPQCRVFFDQLL